MSTATSSPLHDLFLAAKEIAASPSGHATELGRLIDTTVDWLQTEIRAYVPKLKRYTPEHLADMVFRYAAPAGQAKQWTIQHCQAAGDSLARARQQLGAIDDQQDRRLAKAETRLIHDLARDLLGFFAPMMAKAVGRPLDVVMYTRPHLDSLEVFTCAKMLMRGEVLHGMVGDDAAAPAAALLLRQSCELRLKNMLGINLVRHLGDGSPVKLPWDFFLNYARERHATMELCLPIAPDLIRKIYTWSNHTVHAGWIPYSWQMSHAALLLEPLFRPGSHGNTVSVHGSVWLTPSARHGVQTALEAAAQGPVVIDSLAKPEAIVVADGYDGSGPSEGVKSLMEFLKRMPADPQQSE